MDDFADKEIARIYFAGRLSEARLVQTELDKQNIDYAVEVEPYLASPCFGCRNTKEQRSM